LKTDKNTCKMINNKLNTRKKKFPTYFSSNLLHNLAFPDLWDVEQYYNYISKIQCQLKIHSFYFIHAFVNYRKILIRTKNGTKLFILNFFL